MDIYDLRSQLSSGRTIYDLPLLLALKRQSTQLSGPILSGLALQKKRGCAIIN